jgi:hypothetical protein
VFEWLALLLYIRDIPGLTQLGDCLSRLRHFVIFHSSFRQMLVYVVFSNQLVNTATLSPADDIHHYVIPPKLLLTNRFYFQQTSGIHAPVEKRKGGSLSSRSPAPIADSFHVATIAGKHSVLNLREINRNNTHTLLLLPC